MTQPPSHWADVRDRPGFLHRMMVELAGDARISLEGDLSRCRFPEDVVVGRDEHGILKRSTLRPRLDFVVLRLVPETVEPIIKQVMAAGLKRAIIHVQIERGGVLDLGAYDNFHSECVVTGPGIGSSLLEELRSAGVLNGFSPAATDGR